MDFLKQKQQQVCQNNNLEFMAVDLNQRAGIANNIDLFLPVHGIRYKNETPDFSGWYLWAGENTYSDADDFFKPLCLSHLLELKLNFILPYLAIPEGYRFVIDDNGYADIWFDPSILI